jgi:hypothetical protein
LKINLTSDVQGRGEKWTSQSDRLSAKRVT